MEHERPIILILGPTAGGKTRLAIDLAKALPGGGECICADSMQVYRQMNIGTAKPSPEQQAEVGHHLLDLIEASVDGFSVDSWLELAERAIDEIRRRRRYPIVVGGTNLYIQALLEGLAESPEPDRELRRRLQAMQTGELRAWLERVDPAAARRIHPNDRKRTIRAIEVHQLTGRPLSTIQQQWHRRQVRPDARIIGLDWPPEAVNRRINARVKAMIDAGLVEEVRQLWQAHRLGRQAREALGYRQIIAHLEGRCSLEDAIEQIKIRTRRFARQQRTWLRSFRRYELATWLPAAHLSPQDLVKQALGAVHPPPPDRSPTDPEPPGSLPFHRNSP